MLEDGCIRTEAKSYSYSAQRYSYSAQRYSVRYGNGDRPGIGIDGVLVPDPRLGLAEGFVSGGSVVWEALFAVYSLDFWVSRQ
jgi:hypothetical protein